MSYLHYMCIYIIFKLYNIVVIFSFSSWVFQCFVLRILVWIQVYYEISIVVYALWTSSSRCPGFVLVRFIGVHFAVRSYPKSFCVVINLFGDMFLTIEYILSKLFNNENGITYILYIPVNDPTNRNNRTLNSSLTLWNHMTISLKN